MFAVFFFEILGANLGGWPILEVKNLKNAEIKQLAHANLITVMLRCLFYTTKGIPMNSRAIEIGHQNRWALGVRDCTMRYTSLPSLPNTLPWLRTIYLRDALKEL